MQSQLSFEKHRTMLIVMISIVLQSNVEITQAGNCFAHRIKEICYDVVNIDINESQCTAGYYSNAELIELDGYMYAENCRTVNITPKRCDVDCGLGQECQWINDEEMCVCSSESCRTSNSLTSKLNRQSVCASNNKTFDSLCEMEAWKCLNHRSSLYKKYDGECQKDCQNVKCPEDSVCTLVKNTGEPICYPKTHCNPKLDTEPVCGTDGVTYPNICALRLNVDGQGRTAEVAHRGHCEKKCREKLCQSNEHCVYSKQLRPVCVQCDFSPRFFIDSGECSERVPVCGDDGRLYHSYCSLLRRQCEKKRYINIINYQTCPNRIKKGSFENQFKYFTHLKKLRLD